MIRQLHGLACRAGGSGSDLLFGAWEGSVEAIQATNATVYLFSNADLATLRGNPWTTDRGRKHAAKPLAKLMLGHEKVPIIAAAFTSPGQLERSVRTLLQHAARRRERNNYVIGVSDPMLAAMKKRARPEPALLLERTSAATVDRMRLLEPVEIPAQLRQALVGESPEMDLVRDRIVRAALGDAPVLILGDSGTGKEVAARAVHNLHPVRRLHGFTAVNCAAIAADLFESELFGYAQGAFTDARREGKKGLWVEAGRGTLFLDEIADLSLRHQAKILRVLEDRSVRPVGEVKPVDVSCRVITATNRDLYAMVQSGEFREDLYFRLRGMLIRTPRLRDHRQDIAIIARHFWQSVGKGRPPLSQDALDELSKYRWPGNARELRAVIVSLATMFPTTAPEAEHVREVFRWNDDVPVEDESLGLADDARLHRVECLRHVHHAEELLKACKAVLRPLNGSRLDLVAATRIQDGLEQRLAELRVLGLHPVLFHSIATFDAVHALAGRLTTFYHVVGRDASEARSYWRRELSGDLNKTIAVAAREVERLLKLI